MLTLDDKCINRWLISSLLCYRPTQRPAALTVKGRRICHPLLSPGGSGRCIIIHTHTKRTLPLRSPYLICTSPCLCFNLWKTNYSRTLSRGASFSSVRLRQEAAGCLSSCFCLYLHDIRSRENTHTRSFICTYRYDFFCCACSCVSVSASGDSREALSED